MDKGRLATDTETPPVDGAASARESNMAELGELLKMYARDINGDDASGTSAADTAPLVAEKPDEYASGKWMRLDPTGFTPLLSFLQQLLTGGGGGTGGDQLDLEEEIEQFVPAMQRCFQNAYGRSLDPQVQDNYRKLIRHWNHSLQFVPGWQYAAAIVSGDVDKHVEQFVSEGEYSAPLKMVYKNVLSCWNKYLQARTGGFQVSRFGFYLTVLGLILYVTDLVSDLITAALLAYKGAWWACALTVLLVYAAVLVSTVEKTIHWHVLWHSPLDKGRVLASLVINWPDLCQCWALCRLEWRLATEPRAAHLVPEWEHRRLNVAQLKFTEGVWEACPQAILQLCLLLPDLHSDFSLAIAFRLVSAAMSLCSAGAALINWEKKFRLVMQDDLPLLDLVVLQCWAVPVTVARLLAMALLLRLHLYWGLACLLAHLVLYAAYRYRADRVPWLRLFLFEIGLSSLQFLVSPFLPTATARRLAVRHALHFACNAAVLAAWALLTAAPAPSPVLVGGVLGFSGATMAVGTGAMALYHCRQRHQQQQRKMAGTGDACYEVTGPTGVRMTGQDVTLGEGPWDAASIVQLVDGLDAAGGGGGGGATIVEID